MASMTTEFYKIVLVARANDKEINYKMIKDIITKVISENAIDNDEYKSIDI